MARRKLDPEILAHLEWLGFVRPTGLVVSAPALVRAGAILDRRDSEGQRLLRSCLRSGSSSEPDRVRERGAHYGTATMEVARLIEWQGRPTYQVVTTANSNKFFTPIFKVDDRAESLIDAIGLFSWRFEKTLHEGSYHAHRLSVFDQRLRKVEHEGDTLDVPPFVQDALSVLYFVRTLDLKVGESHFIDNFTDGKHYPLEVKVLEKEQITVEAGTFDCIVVEPLVQSVGVFKHQGTIKVYLTDDRLKMPVLMKSKVVVGSITAELTSYTLGDIETF